MNDVEVQKVLKSYFSSAKPAFMPQVYPYMAKMIIQEPPKNSHELFNLIGDFITDGLAFTRQSGATVCSKIVKNLLEHGLSTEMRDTIVAERLAAPVILRQIQDAHEEQRKEANKSSYIDPFLGIERTKINFNQFEFTNEQSPLYEKRGKDNKVGKDEKRKQEALDRQIAEFVNWKQAIPASQVSHNKDPAGRRDIVIDKFTLTVGGKTLLEEATLKLSFGSVCGLIGRNGIGKTTLLNFIVRKSLPRFPQGVHVVHVEQEVEGTDMTILDEVVNCDTERLSLMNEQKQILASDEQNAGVKDSEITLYQKKKNEQRLVQIYQRLDLIEADNAPEKAKHILMGLGFSQKDLNVSCKNFSGGWRMRVALAKALFCEPDLLLLDEPTNHLDLDAVIWLEDYITSVDFTIIVVSHAKQFLNNVATEIIHFQDSKLQNYKGNFYSFERQRDEQLRVRKKQRAAQQKQVEHIQKFVQKFRANAKRASLVQSRVRRLQKMDILDQIAQDPSVVFVFPQPQPLNPPMLRLDEGSITYESLLDKNQAPILKGVNFNVDMESRIAVVGPNGAGKTTLLKALVGELPLQNGFAFKHNRIRIAMFAQYHLQMLNWKMSALQQLEFMYPDTHMDDIRSHLAAFGISGSLALRPIYLLSGGQKSRVALAAVTMQNPHVLILDEPTNHLDMDAVNALIVALNSYGGGIVLVSHDQYFVGAVCNEICVVKDGGVSRFKGSFDEYKRNLLNKRKR